MRVGADYHLQPGETLNDYLDVAVGDMIDVIPWGWRAYQTEEGHRTIWSIANHVKVYFAGNHDYLRALLRLFAKYDIITTDKGEYINEAFGYDGVFSQEIKAPINSHYIFRHGDQYAPDWRWLRIGADDVNEFMTGHKLTKWLWYWYAKRKGWMRPKKSRALRNRSKYTDWYLLIWQQAMKEARENNCTVVIGHTHYGTIIGQDNGARVINLPAGEPVELDI